MPTDSDRDNLIDGDEGAGHEPDVKAGSTPNFTIDTEGLQRSISDGVRDAVSGVFRQFQPAPSNPDETELQFNDDDDDMTRTQKIVHNSQIPLRKQIKQLENFGISKLGDLTSQEASRRLPYYDRYRGEIDAKLKTVDPALRADFNTQKLVHDTIVADHMTELIDEGVQQKARRDLQDAQPPKPGGSSRDRRSNPDDNSVPTPDDLFDEDQVSMINERGGPDAFARRVSSGRFQSWADYAKSRESMATAKKSEGRRIIPFRRWEPKKPA